MAKPDVEKSEDTINNSNMECPPKQQNVEKANERPEWLPDGWTVDFRTRKSGAHMGSGYKCYIDPLNGYKFYSKPEVLRYLETMKDKSCTPKKGKKCPKTQSLETVKDNSCTPKKEKCSNTPSLETLKDNNCTPKKETECPNTQSLETVKDNSCTPKKETECPNTQSVETVKDNSCTPKKEMEYPNTQSLETVKDNTCTPKKEKKLPNTQSLETVKDNSCTPKKEKKLPNTQSPSNVVIEKSIAEDLPPGWIKEIKIRQTGNGIRKDPFYKDPVNGYVFRSKKDVLRYLASGDIATCAYKPSRRQTLDGDKLAPSSTTKRQKLEQSAPKQHLCAGKEIFDKSSLKLPDANSSIKGLDVSVQSGITVALVPADESVVNVHSLEEDGAENLSEMKKISDPVRKNDDMLEKEHVENMMENASEKNHSKPSISKSKKEFNVRCRSSPRLAGVEPVQLANTVINEQTLQVPKRNSRKSRTALNVDLENKSSDHFHGVPEPEHAHKNQKEVINTSKNISEDQAVAEEQANKLETDKIGDNKPEIHTSSKKFIDKRERHIPRRASKRLAGSDHELINNSVSSEKTPKYESKKSGDEVNAGLQQSEGGPATVLAYHAPINGESANKRRKSSKIPPVTDDPLEKLKGEEIDDEKSDPRMSFAFHYSWSDPSLENAISALTSVLPVENSTDTGPTTVPQTDIGKKSETGPTTVPQTDIGKKCHTDFGIKSDIGPTTVPQTDIGKRSVDNVTGKSRDRNPQVHSNKSKKKELKVPMRVSKRLAGIEPESKPSERALEYAPKRSCKKELTATEISVDGASDHLDIEEDTNLECQASHGLKSEVLGESSNKSDKSHDALTVPKEQLQKTEVLRESSNKSHKSYDAQTVPKEQMQKTEVPRESSIKCDKSYDAQTVPKEQMQKTEVLRESSNKSDKSYDAQTIPKEQFQKVESDNIGDERSEPQLPMTFGDSWSDPCLDFAFKTLTGALPFDAATNMLPIITPDLNDPPNKEFYGSVITSNSEEAQDNSNQSQKEYRMVTQRPSEPLPRQPELGTSPTSCENATTIPPREPCGNQNCITRNLDGEPVYVDARNVTQLVHHSRNVNTIIHKEPVQENRQVRKGEPILTDQPPPGFESQLCTSFMNSWSDPCLEFAFKTLTGVIPVEENFALPGCFQQPANCHDQRDGGSFAIPGCFQQPANCHDRRDGGNFAIPGCFQQPANCHDQRDGGNFAIPGCFQQPATCHDRRDGGSTLPEFGSSSFSLSDNPFYYDIDVNSMPGQQSSRSFPFQSLEKPSLQGCPEVAPQNQYSQCNKNFQR